MTTGLLAPLGPQEETALRRIAHGSYAVDAQVASKLIRLALVEPKRGDLGLTPLGQLRYDALPKAPLLARRRSKHAVSNYVDGLIEKAQQRKRVEAFDAVDTVTPPASTPEVPPKEKNGAADIPLTSPPAYLFDQKYFETAALRSMERVRRNMLKHEQAQAELCASSRLRIQRSRMLLEQSVAYVKAG